MGLVPNHEFMRINTNLGKFLMLKLSSIRSVVGLIKTGVLDCPARTGGPS